MDGGKIMERSVEWESNLQPRPRATTPGIPEMDTNVVSRRLQARPRTAYTTTHIRTRPGLAHSDNFYQLLPAQSRLTDQKAFTRTKGTSA